jgi:hypothetical protein
MIFIVLSWVYITFLLFSFGVVCTAFINRITKTSVEPHPALVLISGLALLTCTACLLSLFMPLGGMANIIVILLAVAGVAVWRRRAGRMLSKCITAIKSTHPLLILLFTAFVFIVAYLSYIIPSHYDDGLYYSTTIRWAEEYGVVKGLANLNPRIGFNSSWHTLQALFSFHYIPLGNFNDLNGLLLLIGFSYSLRGLGLLLKKDYRLSVLLNALLFIPLLAFHFGSSGDFLLYNVNYISSPSADVPVCLLLWLTFTWTIEMDELSPERQQWQGFFIVLAAVFLFTIKPSAAPVLLLCIYYFAKAMVRRQFMKGSCMIIAAMVMAGPWIARNIIVSGYVLFPFSGLDIFDVDWKLPMKHVQWFENSVRTYAIDPELELGKPLNMPLSAWVPGWFERLSFIQSLVFIFALVSLAVFGIILLAKIFMARREFFIRHGNTVLAMAVASAGFAFWFLKGPDFRMGYGFAGIICLGMIALVLQYFLRSDATYAGYAIVLVILYQLFVYYYGPAWKKMPAELIKRLPERRMPSTVMEQRWANGMRWYHVSKGDSWYQALPVANDYDAAVILPVPRGSTIKDGFRPQVKETKR